MTKKNVHKENLSIVQEFVDMVNKDNLLELEYEANDFKVKVVKNMKTSIYLINFQKKGFSTQNFKNQIFIPTGSPFFPAPITHRLIPQ